MNSKSKIKYTCKVCGSDFEMEDQIKDNYAQCPNCGAIGGVKKIGGGFDYVKE